MSNKKNQKNEAKQPKMPTHPAKKILDDMGEPYILIRMANDSIMAAKQKKNEPDNVWTNVTDEAMKGTVVKLATIFMNPQIAQAQRKRNEKVEKDIR